MYIFATSQNESVELKQEIWLELNNLGLSPGGFFLLKVKVTETERFVSFNVACKCKRKRCRLTPKKKKDGLFNKLDSLETLASMKNDSILKCARDF